MAVNSGSIKENAIFDLIKFEPILKTYFLYMYHQSMIYYALT